MLQRHFPVSASRILDVTELCISCRAISYPAAVLAFVLDVFPQHHLHLIMRAGPNSYAGVVGLQAYPGDIGAQQPSQ